MLFSSFSCELYAEAAEKNVEFSNENTVCVDGAFSIMNLRLIFINFVGVFLSH